MDEETKVVQPGAKLQFACVSKELEADYDRLDGNQDLVGLYKFRTQSLSTV